MNKIKCPNCGKAVEISEALKHEVEEAVLTEEKIRHKLELETFQKEIEEKTAKKLKDELDFKIKDSANELLEIKEEKKKLQDQLLDMSKSIRELKDQSDKKELENEKKLK